MKRKEWGLDLELITGVPLGSDFQLSRACTVEARARRTRCEDFILHHQVKVGKSGVFSIIMGSSVICGLFCNKINFEFYVIFGALDFWAVVGSFGMESAKFQ